MGRVVKKIVLTGGPCAGKSSSLELIKNYISDLGYLVLVVNESATELINSGIKPFGNDSVSMIEFQEIVLNYQLYKEKLVLDNAEKYYKGRDIVILYDRGIGDYKAYIGEEEYIKLLNKYSLNESDILDDFDFVIFLETAAKSSGYMLENNNARSESSKEAIELDDKLYDAWKIHKNIYKIKSNDDFSIKQNEIIDFISKYFKENKKYIS